MYRKLEGGAVCGMGKERVRLLFREEKGITKLVLLRQHKIVNDRPERIIHAIKKIWLNFVLSRKPSTLWIIF